MCPPKIIYPLTQIIQDVCYKIYLNIATCIFIRVDHGVLEEVLN